MAYDIYLSERIQNYFQTQKIQITTQNMMGGLIFFLDEKMLCGIHFDKKKNTDLLMARIGEEATEKALLEAHCKPMDFTGRPMKGYVFILPEGYDKDSDLEKWLQLCVAFNPLAKSSKKKK